MTAIAPAPEGVAKATIESLYNIVVFISCKGTKSKVSIYLFKELPLQTEVKCCCVSDFNSVTLKLYLQA
jgi:hypothetical protein